MNLITYRRWKLVSGLTIQLYTDLKRYCFKKFIGVTLCAIPKYMNTFTDYAVSHGVETSSSTIQRISTFKHFNKITAPYFKCVVSKRNQL